MIVLRNCECVHRNGNGHLFLRFKTGVFFYLLHVQITKGPRQADRHRGHLAQRRNTELLGCQKHCERVLLSGDFGIAWNKLSLPNLRNPSGAAAAFDVFLHLLSNRLIDICLPFSPNGTPLLARYILFDNKLRGIRVCGGGGGGEWPMGRIEHLPPPMELQRYYR